MISELEKWYLARCNGDWEHQYGVKIETLDNPGWLLKIDLKNTPAESRQQDWVKTEQNSHDWIHYHVENCQFVAAGGPQKLEEMIAIFLRWYKTPEA